MLKHYDVHTLKTESGLACIEFIVWPDPEKPVMVQRYTTKRCSTDGKCWLGPEGREQYLTKEEARAVYAEYQAKGDAKSAKGNLKDATKPRH